jgi:hypothetical protein
MQGNEDSRGDSSNRLRRRCTLSSVTELVQQIPEGQVRWGYEERIVRDPYETRE